MLSEVQLKGLFTGRLAFVEHPEIVGFQLFGVVFIKFKHELYAEQRVRILALLQRAKQEGAPFALVFVFPDDVEFSGIDMNTFKEIYVLQISYGSHLSIVCGSRASQKLKGFGRTATIENHSSISEALMKTKQQYLVSFESKMTRNILVFDSDSQQRDNIVNLLMIDRFSSLGISDFEEAHAFIKKFGNIMDGAIFEFKYPAFREVDLVGLYRELKPDGKILIFSDVLDPSILNICQQQKISSVIKSPFKSANLIRKFKTEFPERDTNYLGFSES